MLDTRSIGMGIVFAMMWASAFAAARMAVMDAPPFLVLSLRFSIAGLIAILVGRALREPTRISRSEWIFVLVFGFCQNALYLGLNFYAMQTIPAGLAAIIASSLPLLVALISRFLFNERLAAMAVLGLIAGFSGVCMIMLSRINSGIDTFPVILCIIGSLGLATATLMVRNTGSGKNVMTLVGLQMWVGMAALLPVSYFTETWVIDWGPRLYLALSYLAIFPGILATFIWVLLVRRIGATRAATFHFLNPFLGVLTAYLLLTEPISTRDFVGVAIISAGILAVQLSRVSKQSLAKA